MQIDVFVYVFLGLKHTTRSRLKLYVHNVQ